jgi:uncharacterized protein (DUF362 family)
VHDFRVYLQKLATLAHPQGGWGYAPGQIAHVEPTCLALLALRLDAANYSQLIKDGEAALERCSTPDGGYREPNGREEVLWTTAIALFVKAVFNRPQAELDRTAAKLLSLEGKRPDDTQSNEVHDIDLKLIGWSWAKNNFSWIEPTAWSCLALRRTGFGAHPRVQEGTRLLLDRIFEDGGVNYGNRQVLGKRTQPITGPTAMMLIALQGMQNDPRVQASTDFLIRQPEGSDDLEHLCWTKLALDCYRDLPRVTAALPEIDRRIIAAYQQRTETNWAEAATPLRQALTALALAAEQHNPFRLEREVADQEPKILSFQIAPEAVPSWTQKIGAKFRGLAVEALGHLRQIQPQSQVHIAKAANYSDDLLDVLERQYAAFRQRVPLAGKRVVLKPNMVEYHRDKVINTNPKVIAAAIELCRKEGAASVIVADGPGHWRNAEYLVRASGLGEVLSHYNVPFVDLNHDEPVKTPNFGRLTGLEYLYVSKTIATAEVVISMPKLKTHHWAGATLSLKNLFGILPGVCYGWPKNELHWRGIDNSIVDIALTRTPELAIVDGIVGMEGDGPLNGTPKPFGALIMGDDLLAVDATCCRLMELEPERIKYMFLAQQKRLGRMKAEGIEQLGEKIADLAQPFETVPHFNDLRKPRSA